MNDKSSCPHCTNTMGFVCGTCIECGFNHLDNSFHFIKVWSDDIPARDAVYLISKHAKRTQRSSQEKAA